MATTQNGSPAAAGAKERLIVFIDEKSYDLTEWQYEHPGGIRVLQSFKDRDATDTFYSYHSENALERFRKREGTPVKRNEKGQLIHPVTGLVVDELSDKDKAMMADWRKVRADAIKNGLLKQYPWYFVFLGLLHFCFYFVGLYLLHIGWWFTGAFLFSIFYHELGLYGHDFSHGAVIKSYDAALWINYFITAMTGYGVIWWKEKHNTHHCNTNILATDPDCQGLPLFCWAENEVPAIDNYPLAQKIIPYQYIYFWIFSLIWKFHWTGESLMIALDSKNHPNRYFRSLYKKEVASLIIFYFITFATPAILAPTWWMAIAFPLVSNALTGVHLTLSVAVNHYASEFVLKDDKLSTSFIDMNVRGTLNVDPTWFNTWYSGTSNYQIEHHLFPRISHTMLPAARKLCIDFCKKHNVPYRCVSATEAIYLVGKRLWEVSTMVQQRYNSKKAQ